MTGHPRACHRRRRHGRRRLLSRHGSGQSDRATRLRVRRRAARTWFGHHRSRGDAAGSGGALRAPQPPSRLRFRSRTRRGAGLMTSYAVEDDLRLAQAVQEGDENAFRLLVERYHPSLLRVAMLYVRNRTVAEEVVQETWLAVISGLHRFERRSLLKTWIFRILTNTAKTRAVRERRTVPFSALAEHVEEGGSVDTERFRGPEDRWAGHWASPPERWTEIPEQRLLSRETF